MGTLYKRKNKWVGRWKDENGSFKYQTLSVDKSVARSMLAKLEREVERRRAGLSDEFIDNAKRPLADHLADFHSSLLDNGDTAQHVKRTLADIGRIVAGCGLKRLSDLTAQAVSRWLASQRQSKPKFGFRTSNRHCVAIKIFASWCWKSGRTIDHRLVGLKPLNVAVDPRHQRRSLTSEDFAKLLETTRTSNETFQGLDGRTRWLLYLTASLTGLRASELASLKVSNLDFDAETFTIMATNTKNRQEATLGLHADLLEQLKHWCSDKQAGDRLFALPKHFKFAKMMRRDLDAVGIPYKVNGYCFDFHALRVQFATMLERAGVSLRRTQTLMRHSTPVLTANIYQRLQLAESLDSVNQIPSLQAAQTATQKTA